jgi:hypothetical protein
MACFIQIVVTFLSHQILSWKSNQEGETDGKYRRYYGDDKYMLVRKPKEQIPFGKPMRKCEDNIKMNLKDLGCESLD